jgi:peptidylprolyl isomerase
MRSLLFAAPIAFVALTTFCGPPPIPARETTANNARSDDPWLMGPRCSSETPADANIRVQTVAEGTGAPVTPGMTVRAHYIASTPDGQVLHEADDMPSEVIIGSTKTICGFERALAGMRPGEQRRVEVPWQLAFGEAGRPPEIAPRADLVFIIDLYLPADLVVNPGGPPPNPIQPGRPPQQQSQH